MFARSSLIETARARNSASSEPWNFSWHAFTDSASIRACAGSYTPHGRSQCACTLRRGARMRWNMDQSPPSQDPTPDASYRRGPRRVAGTVAAAGAVAAAAWTFLRTRPSRVAIEGPSMAPTLLPGDWALVVALRTAERGDVVVV